MLNLTSPSTVKTLMERHGVRFSKGLGQNFIINPGICPKIAEQGGAGPQTGVIEIGAGVGVLTRELALRSKKVVCIEIDSTLQPVLAESLEGLENVHMLWQDVLKTDLHQVIAQHFSGMEVVVCANLPYYITSPILMYLLESRLPVKSITVMVQKEAAARICATPPSRQAGAITAAVHYYSRPQLLFPVSKGSFMPAPKVDSAVIRLDVLDAPPVQVLDEALYFQVVRGAFSQRRKTLLNCLSSTLSMDKAAMSAILQRADVAPSARAEALSLEEFARIANSLKEFPE